MKKKRNNDVEEYMRRMIENMFGNMRDIKFGQPTFYSFSFSIDENGNMIANNDANDSGEDDEFYIDDYRRPNPNSLPGYTGREIQPAPKVDVIETSVEYNITMEIGDIHESTITIYPTENGLFITSPRWKKSCPLPEPIDVDSIESTVVNSTLDIIVKKKTAVQ